MRKVSITRHMRNLMPRARAERNKGHSVCSLLLGAPVTEYEHADNKGVE